MFNREITSANGSASDIRVSLKDFIRAKKISDPIKSKIDKYLADALD
jgi:hypothetical protein